MMQETYPVPRDVEAHALVTAASYQTLYQQSISEPDTFWAQCAQELLDFYSPWQQVHNSNLKTGRIEWFSGATLNACYNCVDRHLGTHGDDIAYLFEPNDPNEAVTLYTFNELAREVQKFANVLKSYGVKKGDRVVIYLPMIMEGVVAMLACARIGAVHSVVFGGFSPDALADRIKDAGAKILITSDGGFRGDKITPVKENADKALAKAPQVDTVIVVKATSTDIAWHAPRDVWYHEVMENASPECPCEIMQAEDPLFILYTSGSTGQPKGVIHTTAGYLLYTAATFKYSFDYHPNDIYWCTADIGWITGHSYIVYGPLMNAATSVVFGGVPNYPTPARMWEIVDKHQINIFYTAPTAIRSLMKEGDAWVKQTQRQSLRILGTVGEPINPEAWEWYYHTVGEEHCRIADTWWQTETGGHMITSLPGAVPLKPGAAGRPFFGIEPAIVDTEGKEIAGEGEGILIIKKDWPGMMRGVWGDHQRFINTYLANYPGAYFPGDGARRDADGDYWITGRVDDVLNVSGHRIGTAEVESALVLHEAVAEAAIVGFPHEIKGQGIYAYVTLMNDAIPSDALKKELVHFVRQQLGPIYGLDAIQWADGLPKTRSGKIMRRILRKIAAGEFESLGDISTLADSEVVADLIAQRY